SKHIGIANLREQPGAAVLDQKSHPLGSCANYRRTCSECFKDRNRHVVEARSVNKNIGLIVVPSDLATRCHATKLHASEFEVRYELSHLPFQRSATDQVQLRVRKFLLDQRKRLYSDINRIIRMKPARAHEMGTKRLALPIGKLRHVDNVGDRVCRNIETT